MKPRRRYGKNARKERAAVVTEKLNHAYAAGVRHGYKRGYHVGFNSGYVQHIEPITLDHYVDNEDMIHADISLVKQIVANVREELLKSVGQLLLDRGLIDINVDQSVIKYKSQLDNGVIPVAYVASSLRMIRGTVKFTNIFSLPKLPKRYF